MPSPEEKIRTLCKKVTDSEDPDEFHCAVEELKSALREHISAVRQNAENVAVLIGSNGHRRAA